MSVCSGGGTKHCENKANAAYQHFLLFLQCFQELSFTGAIKSQYCVVKVDPYGPK